MAVDRAQTTDKRGRPVIVPTVNQRFSVEAMVSIGIPQVQIARVIGIAPKTLRKHFRTELDIGTTKMITRVADSLVQQAIAGNVAACVFILKCRAGWADSE